MNNFTKKAKVGKWEVFISPSTRHGYFEHDIYGEGGSLTFDENKTLIDYDGVSTLPNNVIKAIRECGYHVPRINENPNKRRKKKARKNPTPREPATGPKGFVIYAQGTGKRMAFDGVKFSERTPKIYGHVARASIDARKMLAKYPVLKKYRVWIGPYRPGLNPRRMNPSRRDSSLIERDTDLQKASRLLNEFSGHDPSELVRVDEKNFRKGLVIGELDGVLYTTVRDGVTERYIHKFKKTSRPLLAASSDGRQLGIVGGRFQFTEAGIEDR